jgi:hypothetical protein
MPDDEKAAAEKAATEKAEAEAKAAAEKSEGETSGGVEFDGEFDAARAKKAIEAARAETKKLKGKLERQGGKLDKFETAAAEVAEAEKDNAQKVIDRDERIAELESEASTREVKTDFLAEAEERGYTSPELAYLAAKDQGILGKYTPKTGVVGDHDFEALEESHDLFATEAGRTGDQATGDAGARGGGQVTGVAGQFNKAVRKQILGR